MRLIDFRTLTEQQLDELRMNPGSLRDFASSEAAQGIRAGFEAELVFSGLGASDYDELEADYDMDERCNSIEEVIEFFSNDDWGYGLTPRGERELRNQLDETYMEWYDERLIDDFRSEAEEYIREYILDNEWDEDEKFEEHLEQLGLESDMEERVKELYAMSGIQRKEKVEEDDQYAEAYDHLQEAEQNAQDELESWIEMSINDQDGYWDAALDNFRDNYSLDDDRGFFNDVGLRWMSDIRDQYDLDWPYMTGGGGEGGYNEDNAKRLADDLESALGVKTKVSGGYHSAKRDDVTWIFEPDSSLDADEGDMPVEIISPPMPLLACLDKIEQFFTWAKRNDAYANSSTGFHMGVSMPYGGGDVDYVKLALFLGDEHVLQEFGRAGNHFTEAAMKKIRQRVKGGADVAGAMTLMKNNLLELASRSIQKGGFGKYTSINPNNKYIEFRSAGGSDYFEDLGKLQNTLMRYAQAMFVASRPDLERKEYYKKLYKLIAPPTGDVAMDLFARFATGEISSRELKAQWAEKALEKDAPELVKKGDWVVIDNETGRVVAGQEYRGFSKDEARQRAKEKLSPGSTDQGFDKGYEVVPMFTGKWEIYTKDEDGTTHTLEVVDAEERGRAVDQVYDKYSEQGIAFYARPYYGDGSKKPEPKLTRRAELAKRIKQGPKGQQRTPHGVPEWELYDIGTNNVVNSMVAHNVDDAWQQATDWLRSIGAESPTTYKERFKIRPMMAPAVSDQDSNNYRGTWEFFYEPTGRVLDRVTDASAPQARAVLSDVQRRYNDLPVTSIQMRKVDPQVRDIPVTVDQDTGPRLSYELYQHDTPETVFHSMPNATADEVRAFINQQEQEGMPPGFLRVRLA